MRYTKISQRYWWRMKIEYLHACFQSPTFQLSLLYLRSVFQEESKLCKSIGFLCCLPKKWVLYLLLLVFVAPIETAGAANLHYYFRVWRGEFENENVGMWPWFVIVSKKILPWSKYTITNISFGDVHKLYHHKISLHVLTIHSPLLESR
jgi:hypothetical protein